MRALSVNLVSLLLTAGLIGNAAARSQGAAKAMGPVRGEPEKESVSPAAAEQRLQQATDNFSRLQSLPSLQGSPESASQLWAIQDLLNKARENLTAGNNQAVFEACAQIDKRIGDLYNKERARIRSGGPGPGFPEDSSRSKEQQNAGALYNIRLDWDQTNGLINSYSQRLASGKNPCAAEVLEKIKGMMDRSRQETAAATARAALNQAKALIPELQSLVQENSHSEKGAPNASPGSCSDQPTALAQASDGYRRLAERFTRLTEQSSGNEDGKSAAVKMRIQDFLDKAKEALAAGQPEAAKEFCLKAESQLPELRRTASASGDERLTPAAWQRLKAKLDRAAEIVSASGNDKAAKILEKGQEHLERAQRNQTEGKPTRAEVEMDIALQLAAKAVDIARSGGR